MIFTTHTAPPDLDGIIVNMGWSDTRHLTKIRRASLVQSPQWYNHQVVARSIDEILRGYAGTGSMPGSNASGPIVIVGRGYIGRRVHRWLRINSYPVRLISHTDRLPKDAAVVSIHTACDGNPYPIHYMANQWGCYLVNMARRRLVDDFTLDQWLKIGWVRMASVDGGKPCTDARIKWTPHTAWQGPRSAKLRPRRVLAILQAIAEGKITYSPKPPPPPQGFGLA